MRRVLQARPSQSRSSPGRYPGRPRYSGAAPAAFAATQFRYYLLLPVPTSAAGVVKSDVDGSILDDATGLDGVDLRYEPPKWGPQI